MNAEKYKETYIAVMTYVGMVTVLIFQHDDGCIAILYMKCSTDVCADRIKVYCVD